MPFLKTPNSTLHYQRQGKGPAVLLLSPGGMEASISRWSNIPINPLTAYAGEFDLIAQDERNAGQSTGSLSSGNPWDVYADDHIALLDRLRLKRVLVIGCCIGSSHALRLAVRAPERIAAMVLIQPVGRVADNEATLEALWQKWAERVAALPDSPDAASLADFGRRMWCGDPVMSASPAQIAACQIPMLVLPGIDLHHPAAIGEEIGRLAPQARTLGGWKDSPESIAHATEEIRQFLRAASAKKGGLPEDFSQP